MPPGQLHPGRHIQLDDTTQGVRKEVPNTKERCIGYSKQVRTSGSIPRPRFVVLMAFSSSAR